MYEEFEELGSIIKFFYENHNKKDEIALYFEEVPKGFKEPSIYFPTPLMSSNNYTTHSFQNSYTWIIKLFDKTTLEAQEAAMWIVNVLADKRYIIRVYNTEGIATNRYIKIDSVEARKIDMGVMQIELKFNLAYFFNKPDWTKFKEFYLKDKTKED